MDETADQQHPTGRREPARQRDHGRRRSPGRPRRARPGTSTVGHCVGARRRTLRPRVGCRLPGLDGRARGRRVPARLVRHVRGHPRRGRDRRCAPRTRGVLPSYRRTPALALAGTGAARVRDPADDDARCAPRTLHPRAGWRRCRGGPHRDRGRICRLGPRAALGAHPVRRARRGDHRGARVHRALRRRHPPGPRPAARRVGRDARRSMRRRAVPRRLDPVPPGRTRAQGTTVETGADR